MQRRNKRICWAFCFCVGIFVWSLGAQATRIVIERIVAVVNSEVILWSEWKQQYEALKARLEKTLDEDKRKQQEQDLEGKVLNKMVEDKLLDQQARKLQIDLTEAEINAAVGDTQKRHGLTSEQFLEALREQGFTMASYRDMMRRELRKLRLLQQVLRQKINISEEEVKKYYADTTRGMKPGPKEYQVRQILISLPTKSNLAEAAKKKTEADNLLKLAQTRPTLEHFVQLVRRFSQGPWKDKDGDLGFLGLDSLPEVIAKVIPSARLKQVYPEVLRSVLGFHVIYLENVRSSGLLSYQEARDTIKKKLQQQAFHREYGVYVKDLRKKAVIELRLKVSAGTSTPIAISPAKKSPQKAPKKKSK